MSVVGGILVDVGNGTSSPVFVGRAGEIATLSGALREAEDAEPRTVLIAGEAGVGKTRLVTEFASTATAAGARVLVGGALELGAEGLPYAPFTAALRSLVRELGVDAVSRLVPDVGALAPCLPELGRPDRNAGDPTARGPLFEAFLELVEGLAAQRRLVLVIEDLQWADRSTRELLVFILRSLRVPGVLLIATYRSDDLHRRHPLRPLLAELARVPRVERLDLGRLSRHDVAAQAAGILGHEPEPALVDLLVGRAEGNPLFVEALLCCEDEGRYDISESLRDLLLRTVERLPDPAQRVLRVASAGGTRIGHRLLAAVTPESDRELAEALRAAVEANILVVDEETFAFRHALIRETVHDELLPGENTALHQRYAEAIEADPSLVPPDRRSVEIAHHWYAAHVIDRAVTAAWAAAEEAGAAFAFGEQLALLERVLALWDRAPDAASRLPVDHVGLLEAAGQTARTAGDPARADSYATAGLAELDADREPMRAAALLELRGRSRQQIGHLARFDDLRQAARLAEAEPDREMAARVLAFLAGVEILHCFDEQARATAERALALSRRIGADGSAAHALTTLALCDSYVGDLDGALRRLDEAQALAERCGDDESLLRCLVDRSDMLMGAGQYERAVAVARSGAGRARAAGLGRNHGAFLAINVAEAQLAMGHWPDAVEVIDDALDLDPPPTHRRFLIQLRAVIALRRGEIDAATRTAGRSAGADLAADPIPQHRLPQFRLEAELALAHGDPARAVDLMEGPALLDPRPTPARHAWPLLAIGARACGELRDRAAALHDHAAAARADSVLDRLTERAGALAATDACQESDRLTFVAERLRGDAAAELAAWDAVAALRATLKEPYDQAYAEFRAAEAAVRSGDRAGAGDRLATAAGLAAPLPARGLEREITLLAQRARITFPVGSPAEAAPMPGGAPISRTTIGLTERELDVLRLVTDGKSNREIGATLFISPKTASVHVSNILAKLDVDSRTAAAATAHQLRLFDEAAARRSRSAARSG